MKQPVIIGFRTTFTGCLFDTPRTAILGLIENQNTTIRGAFHLSIDYSSLADRKQDQPYLSDVSESDKPWDLHKASNEELSKILATVDDDYISHVKDRLRRCAPELVFAHTTPDERERTFKLHRAEFCRVRTCPVCQWRRSMLYIAKLMKAVPAVLEAFPTMRLIHLVLTIRNCSVNDLSKTIKEMNKSWQRLTQRKRFRRAVKGFVRSTEVSYNAKTNEAHPHFHIMLFVPSWYFTKPEYYIAQAEWVTLWQQCARLDYAPSVHVKAFRQNDEKGLAAAVHEVAKYTTKPEELIQAGAEWLATYIHQVRNLRFFSTGGIIKKILGEIEQEYEDLIHTGEEETDDSNILAQSLFDWKNEVARYRHKETRLNPNIPSPAGIDIQRRETPPLPPP